MSAFPVLLLLSSLSLSVQQVPNPRLHHRWVSDTADVLDAASEARMNTTIARIERTTGAEIAVVTVRDVPGAPKEFAADLMNRWVVGKAERNNGVLMLLVLGQRRVEIETGYGLEALLPDGWLGQMQTQHMVPAFKREAYDEGLEAGLNQIVARLSANTDDVRAGVDVPELDLVAEDGSRDWTTWATGGLGVLGAGGLGVNLLRARWRRARTCRKCNLFMDRLDEKADDAHLDAGERREEQLGSVNYDVYQCRGCEIVRTFRSSSWFSSHEECPSCGYRTLRSREKVLLSATTTSSGTMLVTVDCEHCHHHDTFERTIPMRQESSRSFSSGSSSSSSTGGSFGGGRSGGGGAGSSW